jgi:CHAT domain-containing protein/tetratricopeptide (TPR) repeat protein
LDNQSKQLQGFRRITSLYTTIASEAFDIDDVVMKQAAERTLKVAQVGLTLATTMKSQDDKAQLLLNMGDAYKLLIDYSSSLKSYEKSLVIYQSLNNKWGQVSTLIQMMRLYSRIAFTARESENYTASIEADNKTLAVVSEALQLNQSVNNPNFESQILAQQSYAYNSIGLAYLKLSSFEKAEGFIQKGLTIAQKSKNLQAQNSSLALLGAVYASRGEYRKLIEVNQRSLEIARQIGSQAEVSVLLGLSTNYQSFGNIPKSTEIAQQALLKLQAIDVTKLPSSIRSDVLEMRAVALGIISSNYQYLGDYEKALNFGHQRLSVAREIGNLTEQANALLAIGQIHTTRKEFPLAITSTEQAWKIAQALTKPSLKTQAQLELEVLLLLSQLYIEQENLPKALELSQEGLKIAQNAANSKLEISALAGLSKVYAAQGNISKAFDLLNLSVILSQKLPNAGSRGANLLSLAIAYLSLGDYKTGRELLQQALVEGQKSLPLLEATAWNSLAYLSFVQGKPQQTIDLAQKGIQASQGKFLVLDALTNLVLSTGYGELGNDAKAMEAAQVSLAISRKLQDPNQEKSTLALIGSLHRKFGRSDQAIAAYQSALAIGKTRDSYGVTNNNAGIYAGLAKIYTDRNQTGAAIAFYKQAINGIEGTRRNLQGLSTDLQKSFLQSTFDFGGVKVADIYRQMADLLISQGRILEAQQILELLRVEEIKDATQPLRGTQKPDNIALSPLEQELTRKYGSLIAFGRTVEQQCRSANLQPSQQCPDLLKQLRKLNEEYYSFIHQFDNQIRNNRSDDEATIDPTQLDRARTLIEATQKKTGKTTVLVYPLVLDNRLWIVWVSSADLKKSQAVPVQQKELAGKVVEFRRLMQECEQRTCDKQHTTKIQAVSRQLYDWLIRPIEPELTKNNVGNLVFALDRIVRYIPMAALYDGKQYLIQKYTVSTVLSAALTQTGDRAPFTRGQTPILGLGLSKPVNNITVAGLRYSFGGLPYVPIELGAIGGIFPGEEPRLDNFDANTLATELYKRKYRILHLATHGKFVPGNALASFLLLGNGQPFTIKDIQDLTSLDTIDLVVLSACESALGGAQDPNKLDGIEISSMSYQFLNKQAKTVLASLWQVNDPSTALLMQEFYKHLADGKTKAQALQEAQASLLTGQITAKDVNQRRATLAPVGVPERRSTVTDFSHPYYWAPFILIGNSL